MSTVSPQWLGATRPQRQYAPARPQWKSSLIGEWIGYNAYAGVYCRLRVAPDGTGVLLENFHGPTPRLHAVRGIRELRPTGGVSELGFAPDDPLGVVTVRVILGDQHDGPVALFSLADAVIPVQLVRIDARYDRVREGADRLWQQ